MKPEPQAPPPKQNTVPRIVFEKDSRPKPAAEVPAPKAKEPAPFLIPIGVKPPPAHLQQQKRKASAPSSTETEKKAKTPPKMPSGDEAWYLASSWMPKFKAPPPGGADGCGSTKVRRSTA